MALDRGLVAHVLEMLEPLGGITGRAMFGGYGVWHDGQMFALFDKDSSFYLKVGDVNRAAFEAADSTPFTPPIPVGRAPMAMPYYEAPASVLDDAELLRAWARDAIEVAHGSPAPRSRKRAGG